MFLYQRWLCDTLRGFVMSANPPHLKGRPIIMSPRQYSAALMQAYFGQFSLGWISEVSGIPLEFLQSWRRETEFLLVMDWSKAVFAQNFRELLQLNDYSVIQYHEIAAEYSLLEHSLRVAIRTRLYEEFLELGISLLSRQRGGQKFARSDLTLFHRLLLFFLALEHYWPSPAATRLREQFLPLAQEVVWPRLGLAQSLELDLKTIHKHCALPHLRQLLDADLREFFAALL